jgi:hypothetical protein
MKLHDVFVSHTSQETGLAQTLKAALTADFPDRLEFFVSSDTETLLAGDKWLEGLQQALTRAEVVLVLCSQYSVERPWVNFEAGAAWIRDTRVIPVCHSGLRPDELPVPLNMLQGIDVGRPHDLERLYRTFAEGLGVDVPERDFEALAAALTATAEDVEPLEATMNLQAIDVLKTGDVSDVVVALDTQLKRTVVKKTMKQREQAEDFIETARAATTLSGLPSFISVYWAGFGACRRPYIVMQHLEKGNLSKHIRRHEAATLDLEYTRKVIVRIGEAMYQAHNRKVAIGNLKSTNILLDERYEPYLLPRTRNTFLRTFELRNAVSNRLVTLEDLVYTAPEVLSRAGSQDTPYELSDQYSLGILAYELLTGELPPTLPIDPSLTDDERLDAACRLIERRGDAAIVELPPVKERRREVPNLVSSIIQRMVSLDPQDRYPRLDVALGAWRAAEQFLVQEARESYVRCLATARTPGFFECFYDSFTGREGVVARFASFDRDRWTAQHGKLRHALDASFSFVGSYVPNIDVPEPNALTAVAASHGIGGLEVGKTEYRGFVDALIETVCGTETQPPFDTECADPARRDEVEVAWRELMKPVVRYFVGKGRADA